MRHPVERISRNTFFSRYQKIVLSEDPLYNTFKCTLTHLRMTLSLRSEMGFGICTPLYSDLTHEDSDIIQEDLDLIKEDLDLIKEDSDLIKEDSDLLQQDTPDLSQQHHHNCPTNHHYEAARSCAEPRNTKLFI